jgi:RsiW-degrading membrane proteinase PrsW (M82 family)
MSLSHVELEALLGLVPVLLFLAVLLYIDSFKLVGIATVTGVLFLGVLAAGATYFISGPAMSVLHLNFRDYSRYLAPVLEETLKAGVMIYFFRSNRIGFAVDAAILGFAVGAGFSLFENVYYAFVFPNADLGVWMVRGLGTAIMHGGVTAVFGITTYILSDRHTLLNAFNYLPGLVLAISLHSIFNQFTAYPLISTAVTIVALPVSLLFFFDKSEHYVHDWLINDYESHENLLDDIRSGKFVHTEAGRLIVALAARFGTKVIADIFAYLRLHTELVIRAEQVLLAREGGDVAPLTKVDADSFKRLHALERRIGRTAMLATWPHLKFSRQELWELHQLEKRAGRLPA